MNQLNTFSIPDFIKPMNQDWYDGDICAHCSIPNNIATLYMIELDMLCMQCIEEFRAAEEKFWREKIAEIDKKRKQEEDLKQQKRPVFRTCYVGFPPDN